MVIDPVSDMLTRIRNAITRKHKNVQIPSSKFKVEIARIDPASSSEDNIKLFNFEMDNNFENFDIKDDASAEK